MIAPLEASKIWSDEEKRAWALPAEISVSAWADENIVLPRKFAAEPGPFRTARTPYLREPMNAFADPLVESISMMFATQIGKTQALHNLLAYIIDQCPGPTLYVMGREEDAKRISYNRVKPLLEESEHLRRYLPRLSDDVKKLEYIFPHMNLRFSGSNSPPSLASDPIKYIAFDEVDKYPLFSGREADPLSLGTERQKTFWDRKTVYASTPTTREGRIFRLYEKSDRRRFYVPCPHCGEYQVLNFYAGIKFGDERDPDKIEDENLAWYECQKCYGRIDDHHKVGMLEHGVWTPDGCTVDKSGTIQGEIRQTRHRGYHLSALYSPWVTFSQIAAKFLRDKDNPETLMNFVNSWLAEVWEETAVETKEDVIRRLSSLESYPEGIVPRDGLVLTAGVDVQEDKLIGSIRAWGYGEKSWGIRIFEVDTFDDLEIILFRTAYKRAVKGDLTVTLACIDYRYRQSEVFNFCRKWRHQARPTMGYQTLGGIPWRGRRIERKRRTGEVVKGGMIRWDLDTNFLKDRLSRLISADYGDPNQWLIYEGVSENYIKQMCSEHKVIERSRKDRSVKIFWQKKSHGTPNHFWDCEVYNVAAADMLKIQLLRPGQGTMTYQPAQQRSPGGSPAGSGIQVKGSSWVNRQWNTARSGGSWMRR